MNIEKISSITGNEWPAMEGKPFDLGPTTEFVRACTDAARLAIELDDRDAAKAILRSLALAATPMLVINAE
jgi:hypothetical protein